MYNEHKSVEQIQKEALEILEVFNKAGIPMVNKKKSPLDGEYDGIVGKRRGILEIDL